MPPKLLIIVFLVLAVVTAVVFWPKGKSMADFPPPMSRTAVAALPDDELVGALVLDLSHRLFRTGYDPNLWKTLPDAARSLWVSASLEPRLRGGGFLLFLITHEPGTPGLQDIRDAYAALGSAEMTGAMDEAITVEKAGGRQAAEICVDYFHKLNATPYIRPPGFVDPFVAADARFKSDLARSGIDRLRSAFVRQHLDEVVAR